MLNHIVMWKIKEEVEDKEKVKLDIKNGLEGLFGKIKELRENLDRNTAIIYDLDHIYAESKYKLIKI